MDWIIDGRFIGERDGNSVLDAINIANINSLKDKSYLRYNCIDFWFYIFICGIDLFLSKSRSLTVILGDLCVSRTFECPRSRSADFNLRELLILSGFCRNYDFNLWSFLNWLWFC